MKYIIYVVAVVTFFILTIRSKSNFADEKTFLLIDGIIKQNLYFKENNERCVGKVVLTLFDENKEVIETHHSNNHGKFILKLQLRKRYELVISKQDFLQKKIIIDTNLPSQRTSSYLLHLDIYIFELLKDIDLSTLEEVTESITFNSFMNEFLFNSISYTEMINTNKKMTKLYAAYYSNNKNDIENNLVQIFRANNPSEKKTTREEFKQNQAKKTKLAVDEVIEENNDFHIQLVELVKTKIPTNSRVFSKCGQVYETCIDSLHIYTTGDFKDIEAAQERLSEVITLGFKDAFIFTNKGDKRIAISAKVNVRNK